MTTAALRSAHDSSYLASLWTLFVLAVRQHLHGKRWMVMAALFVLPALLAVVIRATASDAPSIWLEFILIFMFIPQALLPLVALVYSSGIIQDEQEDQTLTYLLIRPIPRWSIYVVKLLAALVMTVILTAIFTTLTYIVIHVGADSAVTNLPSRCAKAVVIHSTAVVAYCCLFGLIGLMTKRALVVGIIYAAVVEGILANLPLSIRMVTVIYYTRIMAYRSMEFIADVPHKGLDIAAGAWKLDSKVDPQLSEHPSLALCVLILGVASMIFTTIAAVMCSRREFHVKTPEGS